MWTWWVSRSSSAPVNLSDPNTPVHSSNGRLELTMIDRGKVRYTLHARAKKLARAAECLVYSLTPSGVLAENHPKNRGLVGILRGQKCLRRGQKCLKRRFFTAIPRWRVVSRRALDASGF